MTTKRGLITDSFKVVKKARGGGKPPPLPQEAVDTATVDTATVDTATVDTATAREEELHTLRHFDLDWRFGPCTGISRLQRWERSKLHGLSPPEEIRELLLQTHTDPEYNSSLWSGYPL